MADTAAEKAKIEAQFQTDIQAAHDKRNKALSKYPSDNIAEAAHDAIKGDDDLPFALCPYDLRQKLEYVAGEVVKTGAATTDFEKKVLELSEKTKKATA